MRHLALLAVLVPSVALAQSAPSSPARDAASDTTSKDAAPKNDKPKGRIIDPWGRIPRPRDGMRLPNPAAAAEKATAAGTVAPASPAPAAPSQPAPEPHVAAEPASATPAESATPPVPAVATLPVPAPAPARGTMPPLPPPKTPFGTTTMRFVKPPAPAPHEGLTVEAGTGIGWIHIADRSKAVTSPGGVAGLSIGIGAWLDEKVAATVRLAGSSVPGADGLVVAAFLGPSLQIWFAEHTWFGVGFGLATLTLEAESAANDVSYDGYAGDLRLGHTFYENGKHTITASLEVTPGRVSEQTPYGGERSLGVTSMGVLFGWQYL